MRHFLTIGFIRFEKKARHSGREKIRLKTMELFVIDASNGLRKKEEFRSNNCLSSLFRFVRSLDEEICPIRMIFIRL